MMKAKVKAKFAGRNAYEIKVKQGKQKVRRIIYIPLFNSSKRLYKEICAITEELLLLDYYVSDYAIYEALLKEAVAINHSIPDWYLNSILY